VGRPSRPCSETRGGERLPCTHQVRGKHGPVEGQVRLARDAGGAGLGLAIVQAIVHAHGGRAVAGNRDGGGAVVRLEIPRSPEPAQ